jgi:hypothetical protein
MKLRDQKHNVAKEVTLSFFRLLYEEQAKFREEEM